MDEQIRKFNNQIRELLTLLENELPKNGMMDSMQRKFRLAVSVDRTCLIEETIPELMSYRDFIADGRIDELINMDWDEEVDKRVVDEDEDLNKNSIRDMIKLIKDIWNEYDDDQKKIIGKILKRLLNYSIKYQRAKINNQL